MSYDASVTERGRGAASTPSVASAAHSFGLDSGQIVTVVAVLAAGLSMLSDQTPTGNAGADLVLSALFGVAFVWLATFARGSALLVSAVLVLIFSALQLPASFMAAAAVASAAFMTMVVRLDRSSWTIAAAVTGMFTGQAALNLPNYRWTGSASVFAAIALIPLAVSFLTTAPSWLRRRAVVGVIVSLVACLVAAGMAAGAALSVRSPVEAGISQARDGIAALQDADDSRALELLEASQGNFSRANGRLSGPLTWPARVVPIVAQHSRALDAATAEGNTLARTAVQTATAADIDAIRGEDGKIDLSTVVSVGAELNNANAVLASSQLALADVRSDWLLPQLTTRLNQVQSELLDARTDVDLAANATAVIPRMLGAEGRRSYLLLFLQPAEAREFGGFVGQYAVLHVEDGNLSVGRAGSSGDFNSVEAVIADPETYPPSFFARAPERFMQNLTGIADLTTIRRGAVDLWPQWTGEPDETIDGVVTIDPYAVAALLELSGPVLMPTWGEELTAENAVDYLLRDQYIVFDADDPVRNAARKVALEELVVGTLSQLLEGEIPGPELLGRVLGPVARSNRLAVSTNFDDENLFLHRILLSADMPRVGTEADLLGVFSDQTRASKIDAYLTTSVDYVVDVDPSTGAVDGQATISIANAVPDNAPAYVAGALTGLEEEEDDLPFGVGRNGVIVWSQQELMSLTTANPAPFRDPSLAEPLPSLGLFRQVVVAYAGAGTTTVSARTSAQVPPGGYDLVVPAMLAANSGEVTVTVRPTAGWRVNAADAAIDGSWTATGSLDDINIFTVSFVEG